MARVSRRVAAVSLVSLGLGLAPGAPAGAEPLVPAKAEGAVRIATFNVSLYRDAAGALIADLDAGSDQAHAIAEIIQRVRPDVLLLNEIDHDPQGRAVALLQERYLAEPHNGAAPVFYPHRFLAPVNTGQPSGHDLNRDGEVEAQGAQDAWGYGVHPGQYGMAVLSKLAIDAEAVRTFQHFRWADMPGAKLPDDPATEAPGDWYGPEVLRDFPLSSKSHWDVPLRLEDGRALHLLASHPTPPGFDGPEDRNGRRNHDEIRLWADYVTPGAADYLYDNQGGRGGLDDRAAFVIAGDLNADPDDGAATAAIAQLLDHPRIETQPEPASDGAVAAARRQGGANDRQWGDPATDTADFSDGDPSGAGGVGNLRVDYVLPGGPGVTIVAAGVFWPTPDNRVFRLVGDYPFPSSDHRLVWVDVRVDGASPKAVESEAAGQ
nr:endonuclease/exonuclease/phosphatase family protein [Rhodothalassium salexigens]